jgi:hypothetical protein
VPKWRAPLLVAVLLALAVIYVAIRGCAGRADRASRACFEAMFRQQHDRAAKALDAYRDLGADEIPPDVRDEVYKLEPYKNYPVAKTQFDDLLIERAAFYALASDHAVAPARDLRGAALCALGYVREHLQSGTRPETDDLAVTPVHALYRGYGDPALSAWAMAALLRHRRGIHACVIQLLPPDDEEGAAYSIVGVVIDRRLYLFDPYRGVPLCRASDLAIADLQGLLSGRDTLAPGFGGVGTLVTLDALRRGLYFVPADISNVLPDAWLL